MDANIHPGEWVAVIGAGPAGLFAAKQLAADGCRVVIFNRDIKPGGLAEYGIYPDKYKMKDGLRSQFRQIVQNPNITYLGNVRVAQDGDLRLDEIRSLGFRAVLVTIGAQGTKWLGLPGEHLEGSYHAKDIVYHYNLLPPFSQRLYRIGQRVAVVGVGNVMLDVVHWLIQVRQVGEVIAIARRGPNEVKFDRHELEYVAANLDLDALDEEIARHTPAMQALGQDPNALRQMVGAAREKAVRILSDTHFQLRFLLSPRAILGDDSGRVNGLELEENTLKMENGEVKARGTGNTHVMNVDSVIFAIGDRIDPDFGLPVSGNEYVHHPQPRFPVEDASYEAYDPATQSAVEGMFIAGWSHKASEGLVGVARRDGTNGAKAVKAYLQSLPPQPLDDLPALEKRLTQIEHPIVRKQDLERLNAVEAEIARERGLLDFKFGTNEEMLAAIRVPA